MKALLLFALSLSCSAFAQDKVLTIVGDSLTEGYGIAKDDAYPNLVSKSLPGWKVINSGVSGSTSASAPGRITWALKTKPDAILIALGGNDGLRGLSASDMKTNLSKAVQAAKDANVKVMLVGIMAPPNYGGTYGKEFSAVFPAIAKEKKIPLFPFLLEEVAGQAKLNLPDGIHPNEAGHKKMAEKILPFLKKELGVK